jgi:hypothetical protein
VDPRPDAGDGTDAISALQKPSRQGKTMAVLNTFSLAGFQVTTIGRI